MELLSLNRALDTIFGKNETWSEKEMDLYELLLRKLRQYRDRAQAYRSCLSDHQEILANIKEQPWYSSCRQQGLVQELVKQYELQEYKAESDLFWLKIKFTRFILHVEFRKELAHVSYLIYVEPNVSLPTEALPKEISEKPIVPRAYVAYNISAEASRDVPEYALACRITGLDRYTLVCLLSEILIFYDTRETVQNVLISKETQVTLKGLRFIV